MIRVASKTLDEVVDRVYRHALHLMSDPRTTRHHRAILIRVESLRDCPTPMAAGQLQGELRRIARRAR